MTIEEARAKAQEVFDRAASMGASHPHAETEKQAVLAGVIVDLCEQLEVGQRRISELEAENKPKGKK